MILQPPKLKSVTVSIVSLSICLEVMVNKAEVDVFLEPSWFFNDPLDVGNLISGEGNGNPLQYSRLENPMDRGAS